MIRCATLAAVLCLFGISTAQRITTIQLDGVQYFVSRMNPYSPELNFFLAYQYCRSLGLQLVSFETKEKADSISSYLSNAGFGKYDFWTSGNRLGTDMYLWMSTGLPFNATFNYMKGDNIEADSEGLVSSNVPTGSTSPQRTARDSGDSGSSSGCVTLKAPSYEWVVENCMNVKDFICEQTRCYYYNYGSIPVSSAQGRNRAAALRRTTATPASTLFQTRSASKTASTLAASLAPSPSTTTTTKIPNTKVNTKTPNVVTESIHPNYFSKLIMNNIRTNGSENPSTENILKVDIHPVFLHSSTTARLNDKEIDLEQSTNGPYDNYNTNVEMQDEPVGEEEGYISTIPPEKDSAYYDKKST